MLHSGLRKNAVQERIDVGDSGDGEVGKLETDGMDGVCIETYLDDKCSTERVPESGGAP